MLKDISYTKLAIQANLNLDLMYTEQTVVFINNSFLGIMNLRTESNANGMSGLYNANKSDITLAKIISFGELDKKNGDFNRIDNFMNAIKNEDYNYLKNEVLAEKPKTKYLTNKDGLFIEFIDKNPYPHNDPIRTFKIWFINEPSITVDGVVYSERSVRYHELAEKEIDAIYKKIIAYFGVTENE